MTETDTASNAAKPQPNDATDESEGVAPAEDEQKPVPPKQKPGEVGGPQGPEPTRFGDWEVWGRCTDF